MRDARAPGRRLTMTPLEERHADALAAWFRARAGDDRAVLDAVERDLAAIERELERAGDARTCTKSLMILEKLRSGGRG